MIYYINPIYRTGHLPKRLASFRTTPIFFNPSRICYKSIEDLKILYQTVNLRVFDKIVSANSWKIEYLLK